jgi:hypothetical protein
MEVNTVRRLNAVAGFQFLSLPNSSARASSMAVVASLSDIPSMILARRAVDEQNRRIDRELIVLAGIETLVSRGCDRKPHFFQRQGMHEHKQK